MTENIDCMNKSDASPLSSCDQQQIDLIIETEITMEETFDCLNKSDASPPSSCIQQQIVSNTEIEIVMDESKNDELVKPADEIPRSRSYKLIEKFRRLSITSILSNRKGRKASCHTILATQIDIASIPNGAPKLKVCSIISDCLYFSFSFIGNTKKFSCKSFVSRFDQQTT